MTILIYTMQKHAESLGVSQQVGLQVLLSHLPELGCDEELTPGHHTLCQHSCNGLANLMLVLVHIGTVDVPVPSLDGQLHGLAHLTTG